MTDTTTTKTRTITLTDRPPVTIREDAWPIIATGSIDGSNFDPATPNPETECWDDTIRVRQHADGRALVYGVSRYEREYGSGDYHHRAGELLTDATQIVAAIRRVGSTLRDMVGAGAVTPGAIRRAEDECIADLPAVEL